MSASPAYAGAAPPSQPSPTRGEGFKRLALPAGAIGRARRLRANPTEAEKTLWRGLREALPYAHWRRQVALGSYIADFCAHGARLIVEVDGGQHAAADEYDAARTRFMNAEGYRVLRFWNNDVLTNLDGVLTQISHSLGERVSGRSCSQHDLNSAGRCSPDTGAAQRRKGEGDLTPPVDSPSPSHAASRRGPLPLPRGEGVKE